MPITKVRRFATATDTIRVTYDWTLSPTTLLNSRVGFVRHWNPDFGLEEVRNFDPIAGLGLRGAVNGVGFPVIGNMFTQTGGGMSEGIAVAGSLPATKKPQALVNITHSRNTHTYKFGVEWRDDIFSNPQIHGSHGAYSFTAEQTTLPSTQGINLGGGAVGLAYASFLLGRANNAIDRQSVRRELAQAGVGGIRSGYVAVEVRADHRLRAALGPPGVRVRGAGSSKHVRPGCAESGGRRPAGRHHL